MLPSMDGEYKETRKKKKKIVRNELSLAKLW